MHHLLSIDDFFFYPDASFPFWADTDNVPENRVAVRIRRREMLRFSWTRRTICLCKHMLIVSNYFVGCSYIFTDIIIYLSVCVAILFDPTENGSAVPTSKDVGIVFTTAHQELVIIRLDQERLATHFLDILVCHISESQRTCSACVDEDIMTQTAEIGQRSNVDPLELDPGSFQFGPQPGKKCHGHENDSAIFKPEGYTLGQLLRRHFNEPRNLVPVPDS